MTGLSRRWLLQRGAYLGLGMLGLGTFGLGTQAAWADGLHVGQPAPVAVLHTLDGQMIPTATLRGEVVILTFWATWCDPCREELPVLSRYAAAHAAQGLRVLGFCLDAPDRLAQVRAVAETLSFPVGLLPSPWFGAYGRIWRIPVSFVIDRAGRLADNGWDDPHPAWTQERLQRVVGPLLA
ncbi:MAG: TlpA disulfide reductase family protein [Thiomonas sp.]|nr:TlpA disulfide reductase family protein [Thiomonas sp.]